jgi:hypothetical protein
MNLKCDFLVSNNLCRYDVEAAIATCDPASGVDALFGVGGTPEGVIAAAAMRCMGRAGTLHVSLQSKHQLMAHDSLFHSFYDYDIRVYSQEALSVYFRRQFVTASMFHVTNLPPGNANPMRGRGDPGPAVAARRRGRRRDPRHRRGCTSSVQLTNSLQAPVFNHGTLTCNILVSTVAYLISNTTCTATHGQRRHRRAHHVRPVRRRRGGALYTLLAVCP